MPDVSHAFYQLCDNSMDKRLAGRSIRDHAASVAATGVGVKFALKNPRRSKERKGYEQIKKGKTVF